MKFGDVLNKIGEGLLGLLIGFEPKTKPDGREQCCSPACPHSVLAEAKKLSVARGEAHHRDLST